MMVLRMWLLIEGRRKPSTQPMWNYELSMLITKLTFWIKHDKYSQKGGVDKLLDREWLSWQHYKW